MKLGTATGSFINHIAASSRHPEPKVGMGATILLWTDRHAATIVGVRKSRGVTFVDVQRDHAERSDSNGMSEDQGYVYKPDTDAKVQSFSLRKSGEWIEVGTKSGRRLAIGVRREYYDFSF